MTTAGIDFGSTLTKAAWRDRQGRLRYTTADDDASKEYLAKWLAHDGVRKARVTGIGEPVGFGGSRITLERAPESAVDDEVRLQARGARLLIGKDAPRKLIVAAVGTGVSYTIVKGRRIKRHPLGSCHGGGTMLGLGRILGAKGFSDMEQAAWNGTPADLQVKDKLPATAGTPLGELVIAHFSKDGASFEDRCASVFNFAACSIIKDLAVLTSIPLVPKQIAVVGTVSASKVFQGFLERWAPMLKGCTLHFPKHREYAAALGAFADITA